MQNLHEQLTSLEERYWDAIQHKDVAGAMQLSDEPCIVVGAQGVGVVDREQMGQMLQQASYELDTYTFDDKTIRIRKLTDDVAIIAYEVREELVVDGKPLTLVAHDASVWVRRGEAWRCALHTESPKGDPFGRKA